MCCAMDLQINKYVLSYSGFPYPVALTLSRKSARTLLCDSVSLLGLYFGYCCMCLVCLSVQRTWWCWVTWTTSAVPDLMLAVLTPLLANGACPCLCMLMSLRPCARLISPRCLLSQTNLSNTLMQTCSSAPSWHGSSSNWDGQRHLPCQLICISSERFNQAWPCGKRGRNTAARFGRPPVSPLLCMPCTKLYFAHRPAVCHHFVDWQRSLPLPLSLFHPDAQGRYMIFQGRWHTYCKTAIQDVPQQSPKHCILLSPCKEYVTM